MQITYHGRSSNYYPKPAKLLIDPFSLAIPCDISARLYLDYSRPRRSYRGHGGLLPKCDAMVIAMVEIAEYAASLEAKKTHGMNLGAVLPFLWSGENGARPIQ